MANAITKYFVLFCVAPQNRSVYKGIFATSAKSAETKAIKELGKEWFVVDLLDEEEQWELDTPHNVIQYS